MQTNVIFFLIYAKTINRGEIISCKTDMVVFTNRTLFKAKALCSSSYLRSSKVIEAKPFATTHRNFKLCFNKNQTQKVSFL